MAPLAKIKVVILAKIKVVILSIKCQIVSYRIREEILFFKEKYHFYYMSKFTIEAITLLIHPFNGLCCVMSTFTIVAITDFSNNSTLAS